MLKLALLLSFLVFVPSLSHAEDGQKIELACTHVQVCNILEELLFEAKITHKVQISMPFQVQGDPHHFEPGPKVVKTLLEVPFLMAPSRHLSPWLGKIIQQRSQKKSLKSFELPLQSSKGFKEKFSQEVLAHFWLHPKALCHAKKHTAQQLLNWGLIENKLEVQCLSSGIQMLAEKLKRQSQKIPLVLYHDALMPYFSELNIQAFALKGSGHGEQVSIQKLKKFHQYLAKNPRVLWVRENAIHIHSQLKGLQRQEDISREVDTLGKRHQPSSQPLSTVLKDLLMTISQNSQETK